MKIMKNISSKNKKKFFNIFERKKKQISIKYNGIKVFVKRK